jgi:hypothetical protein
VRHDAVEHLPVVLVSVEPLIEKFAQEAAALRRAVGVRILQRPVRRRTLQPGTKVADRDEPNAGDWRVRGAV